MLEGKRVDVYDWVRSYTSEAVVRTNIDIDDALLKKAMIAAGQSTKKGTVEEALRALIRLKEQRKAFDEMRGIGWEGDLEEIRLGWSTRPEG